MDYSEMSTLLSCARKHQLQYTVGVAEDKTSSALDFGAAWHKIMEEHGKQCITFGANIYDGELVERVLHEMKWMDPTDDFRTGDKLKLGYEHWYEQQGNRYQYKTVEGGFSHDVGETEPWTGRKDADILYDPNHGRGIEEFVVDYKTTSRLDADWIDQYTISTQFKGYYLHGKSVHPDLAGVIVDVFHVTKGNKSGKTDGEKLGVRFYNLVLRFDPIDLLEARADFSAALALKARYRETGYAPKNTSACRMFNRTCGFIEVCNTSDPEVRRTLIENLPPHTFNPLEGM